MTHRLTRAGFFVSVFLMALMPLKTNGQTTDTIARELKRGEESFERNGINFRLTWKASKVTTDLYGLSTTKVLFSVYRNNILIHPEVEGGGKSSGCHMTAPEEVKWEVLGKPQIGWLLSLSGICGNTHSFKHLMVIPQGDGHRLKYLAYEFIAKETPIIRNTKNGDVHIWTTYQEWGKTGTWGSFFVPELRMVSLSPTKTYKISCPPLPHDVRLWPRELPYRSFIGDFYAGQIRSDAAVMRSALNEYEKLDFEWLQKQGLPGSKKGLLELATSVSANISQENNHECRKIIWQQALAAKPHTSSAEPQSSNEAAEPNDDQAMAEKLAPETAWKIDTSAEKYIRLHVNGNVTWGDRLMFIFNKFDCSEAEVSLYFSSYEDEIVDYEDSSILLNFSGDEIKSTIISVQDFIPPHRISIIRVGFIEKKALYDWEKLEDVIVVKISTNNSQKLQDAFDVKFNEYSMQGLSEALTSVEENCTN